LNRGKIVCDNHSVVSFFLSQNSVGQEKSLESHDTQIVEGLTDDVVLIQKAKNRLFLIERQIILAISVCSGENKHENKENTCDNGWTVKKDRAENCDNDWKDNPIDDRDEIKFFPSTINGLFLQRYLMVGISELTESAEYDRVFEAYFSELFRGKAFP
jgi:hypothetical protein